MKQEPASCEISSEMSPTYEIMTPSLFINFYWKQILLNVGDFWHF